MHISIDAAPSSEKLGSGIPTYTTNLINSLLELDTLNKYTLYGITPNNKKFDSFENNIKIKRLSRIQLFNSFWYLWTFWYYSFFPIEVAFDRPDVYFSSYPALPYCLSSRKIFVIYDLSPLVLGSAFTARFRFMFSNQLRHAIKISNRIVTISEATKQDIVEILKINPENISVIHPAYDKSLYKPQATNLTDSILKKYSIERKYILFSGTLEPKKNIPRLIKAFSYLKKNKNIPHKLVISGKRAWGDEVIFQAVKNENLEKDVIFTDYIPLEDLPMLMTGAELFVFPSIHEGFGIPPLEAMACATPVITSNTSSLPEVVGDAGILIDPYNVNEISDAIYRVISNSNVREQMRQKGLERAKLFTWEESARKTLALFESVYESKKKNSSL